jgi:hypothetical protein
MEPLAKSSGLGSLVQTARDKHLKQARRVLLGAGIWIAASNLVLIFLLKDKVQENMWPTFIIAEGAVVSMGCLFVVFSFFVRSYPLVITITALVIFLGMMAVGAVIDPTTLFSGIIIKVIIIAALVKALQAGYAAQKEQAALETGEAT